MRCPQCGSELKKVGYQSHYCEACRKVFLIAVMMSEVKQPPVVVMERE